MADNNVSAFAAYNSPVAAKPAAAKNKKKPTKKAKATPNTSFSQLSKEEMINQLISKKKQELKRKSVGTLLEVPAKKIAKRKKAGAQSAPVSRNTSDCNASAAAAAAVAVDFSAPTKPAKRKTPAIKIHPKDPERLSLFVSKGNKKRNQQQAKASHPESGAIQNASTPLRKQKQPVNGNAEDSLFVHAGLSAQSTPRPNSTLQIANDHDNVSVASSSASNTMAAIATAASTAVGGSSSAAAAPLPDVSSIEAGKALLSWIINPTTVDEFMAKAWEQTPLLIDRKCATYYSQLLSTATFDRMLREQRVEFTKNLDVTSYVDGVRHTHNPDGRAMPPTVWDFYRQGCSIRLLNPQTFLPVVHALNATLQEYFQCMTGANVYLTPANSQGFAPHYDDIEAFVLQIEGKKHWKVYKPRSADEQLPRDSSPNFTQAEIGQPVLDVVLEAGDLLYFPRGFIHQATTVPGHHSMHITLSAYQRNSYADLLEHMVPAMLQSTIAQAVLLRRGLPLDVWQCAGLVHSDDDEADARKARVRRALLAQVRTCLELTMKSFAEHIDDAVDKLAVRFQNDALPPALTSAERARTVYGAAAQRVRPESDDADDADEDKVTADEVVAPLPQLDTALRLLRANSVRLVRHSDTEFRIYYHADNTRQYHELEAASVEISATDAPAVEFLVKAYPAWTRPSEWPIEDDEQCVAVAQDLWERGVLVAQDVLQ